MDCGFCAAHLGLRRSIAAAAAALALIVTGCQSARDQPNSDFGATTTLPAAVNETAKDPVKDGVKDTGTTPVLQNEDLSADLDAIRGRDDQPVSMLSRLAVGEPPIAGPTEVATVVGPNVLAYSDASLTGAAEGFANPTQFGGPRVFRVLDSSSQEKAIQISLPIKPNGQTGWIARESVELSSISHQVLVNLDHDSITVWEQDRVLSHTLAVTGTPWTPTPTGIFFMRDVIAQPSPNGSYGSFILALSGFSEELDSFAGGLPAIAIHGTNKPDTMGQERSNGCVRVPNEVIEQLARDLPLGTPVTIVSSAKSLGFGQLSDRFGSRRVF